MSAAQFSIDYKFIDVQIYFVLQQSQAKILRNIDGCEDCVSNFNYISVMTFFPKLKLEFMTSSNSSLDPFESASSKTSTGGGGAGRLEAGTERGGGGGG